MTIRDPAHWPAPARALGAFTAIAAGTAVSVATGGVAGGASVALAGLFTNFLAGDIVKLWEDRRRDPKYGHPNHDLTKLVGQSIARVLYDAAGEPALKTHAPWLRSLAKVAPDSYVNVADLRDFGPIASDQLPEIFRRAATSDGGQYPLLSEVVWGRFVVFLCDNAEAKPQPAAVSVAAVRLHQRLFGEVREMFKRDFAGEGRAYSALCLDMNSLVLAKVAAVHESQKATVAELQGLREWLMLSLERYRPALNERGLAWMIVEVRGIGERIENLLVVAIETKHNTKRILDGQANLVTKDDLKAIEERILCRLGDKVLGQNPREREFPLELIEQAKLLQARGNKEQQATAEIALRNHRHADSLIQELKREPLNETFRLLTLEGHNWCQASEFDRAIEPYEQALALRPLECDARNNAAIAHTFARLGDITAHLQRAIAILSDSLTVRGHKTHPHDWANTQNNLGIAWGNMPTGDKTQNLRKSIAALEAALTVYTREAHPADWARTQNNLGNALGDTSSGDKTENYHKAIAAYEAALTVYTCEAHPVDWAMTQNNLGIARQNTPAGDKTENLHKAIEAYEAALIIYTRDAHPADWARTQNNLGTVWGDLLTGDKTENLHKAIVAYEAALTLQTRETHPVDWALTQNNLGTAWKNMPTGDKTENLQKAIAAYEAALTVRTREARPIDWARTQNNLGTAWRNMPTGDKAENLHKAIAAYEAVLTVRTREAYPAEWARTQNNLGVIWKNMPIGDKPENLQKAIAAYEAAFTVQTREAHPVDWGRTQNNLGVAWKNMPTGDKTENLHKAIAAYEAALTVHTREEHPADWARGQHNMAVAVADLSEYLPVSRCTLLRRAIACGKGALTVHTPTSFPALHDSTRENLEIHRENYEVAECSAEVPFDAIWPAT
jgi:tetratricopeptide (TPR) repeat protein